MDDDQALKTAAEIIAAMTDPMDSAYQGEDGLLWQEWVVPSGLCYDLMADFAEGDQTDPGKRAQLVTAARAMIDVATRARVAELEAESERLRVAPQRPARFSDVVGADRAAEYHRVDRAAEDAGHLRRATRPADDPTRED
jgi:hypothetical protein